MFTSSREFQSVHTHYSHPKSHLLKPLLLNKSSAPKLYSQPERFRVKYK